MKSYWLKCILKVKGNKFPFADISWEITLFIPFVTTKMQFVQSVMTIFIAFERQRERERQKSNRKYKHYIFIESTLNLQLSQLMFGQGKGVGCRPYCF